MQILNIVLHNKPPFLRQYMLAHPVRTFLPRDAYIDYVTANVRPGWSLHSHSCTRLEQIDRCVRLQTEDTTMRKHAVAHIHDAFDDVSVLVDKKKR